MSNQITADGGQSAIYEQTERAVEVAGLPIGNYIELTGGGIAREGRQHVFNGKGEIVGTTNGRAVPQNKTIKMLTESWEGIVKPALVAFAATQGIFGEDGWMKVPFVIVDQWQSQTAELRSYTERQTFKILSVKPDTPNDGNSFSHELELFPTNLPTIEYN